MSSFQGSLASASGSRCRNVAVEVSVSSCHCEWDNRLGSPTLTRRKRALFEENSEIETPPDDTVIWRYVELESLIALLSSSQLHFTRLSDLRDPWEGVWPKSAIDAIKAVPHPAVAQGFAQMVDFGRATCYVNCWHGSQFESAALWDLYSRAAGFALKSDIRSLKRAFADGPRIFIGKVKYIYFDAPDIALGTTLKYAFHKRKSFSHEQEIRVLLWHLPKRIDPEVGEVIDPTLAGKVLYVDVSLGELIHAAYLSPMTPAWLVPHVKTLFERIGLGSIPIKRSELYDSHVY